MIAPIVFLLLIPLVILGCVLLTIGLGLSTTMQAIVTGVVMLAYFVGFCFYLLRRVLLLGRCFDDVMAEAGLEFTCREGVSCKYHGTIANRGTTVRVTPAFRFEPWRFDVSIDASPACRIALGSTRPLLDCRHGDRIIVGGPLGKTHIYTDCPDVAQSLLATTPMVQALVSLLRQLELASSWELYLQQNRVWLRARAYRILETTIASWFETLFIIADACENLD